MQQKPGSLAKKVKHTERESKRNARANSTESVASQKDNLLQIITAPFNGRQFNFYGT